MLSSLSSVKCILLLICLTKGRFIFNLFCMYNIDTLKKAIQFNTIEVLPTETEQLDKEIKFLVDNANQSGEKITHYIGFEVSGQIHIGGGIFQMLQAVELQKAGVEIIFWIADYHTWLNSKLDGDIETIKKVAREYFGPVMLKTFEASGGDPVKVKVLYNYDDYRNEKEGKIFWDYEFECDKQLSLNRILRSLSITGKTAGEDVPYQLTRYPGMQAADVFWLQSHIAQSGLDQRKIYVSTRDIALKIDKDCQLQINSNSVKPICTFSSLILGLEKPIYNEQTKELESSKMSKSKPDSCIFVHDSEAEISRKIKKAYCPMPNMELTLEKRELEQKLNPILNYCEVLIYRSGRIITLDRQEKFGGKKEYLNYTDLHQDYLNGFIHPMDLKQSLSKVLTSWLKPICEYIEANPQKLKLVLEAKK
jgi:tyrosyl-tRNA synthetase